MQEAQTFSGPAMMRSSASAISSLLISVSPRRAAMMAASFIRFCKSAPVKPGVRRATCTNNTTQKPALGAWRRQKSRSCRRTPSLHLAAWPL